MMHMGAERATGGGPSPILMVWARGRISCRRNWMHRWHAKRLVAELQQAAW